MNHRVRLEDNETFLVIDDVTPENQGSLPLLKQLDSFFQNRGMNRLQHTGYSPNVSKETELWTGNKFRVKYSSTFACRDLVYRYFGFVSCDGYGVYYMNARESFDESAHRFSPTIADGTLSASLQATGGNFLQAMEEALANRRLSHSTPTVWKASSEQKLWTHNTFSVPFSPTFASVDMVHRYFGFRQVQFPLYYLPPTQLPSPNGPWKVMSYNVKKGNQSHFDEQAACIVEERPDLLVLQEVNYSLCRQFQSQFVIDALPMHPFILNRGVAVFRSTAAFPGGPVKVRMKSFKDRSPIDWRPYTIVEEEAFVFVGLHANHNHENDIDDLLQDVLLHTNPWKPILLAGDFNRNLKTRLQNNEDYDCSPAEVTFPGGGGQRLDFFMYSKERWSIDGFKVMKTCNGGDHYPIVCSMSLTPVDCRQTGTKVLVKVEGDGDCLYHSVAAANSGYYSDPGQGKLLREDLQRFVEKKYASKKYASNDMEPSVRAMYERIKSDAWGENEEVQHLSEMLGICIVVHTTQHGQDVSHVYSKGMEITPDDLTPCCNPSTRVIHVSNKNGVHYDALL